MKVILTQDVKNIGKKNEIKEVKEGFARNFLIPKGLAVMPTPENIKKAEKEKEQIEIEAEEELKKTQAVTSSLDGQEVGFHMKLGKEGQLFESITAQKIAEKLKELGFNINKNQVDLAEPIKSLGEFPVKVKFEHNLEALITVAITEETNE
jgi:large subunit ribosomal protein L9